MHITIEECGEDVLERAKADGVICSGCDRPHDKIMAQIQSGAVMCDMHALGHPWYCASCAATKKKRLH